MTYAKVEQLPNTHNFIKIVRAAFQNRFYCFPEFQLDQFRDSQLFSSPLQHFKQYISEVISIQVRFRLM